MPGYDFGAACRALDELDNQSLAAIGVEPGITATPVAVRASRRLRLTPGGQGVLTGIRDAAGAARQTSGSCSTPRSICLALTRGRARRRARRGPRAARERIGHFDQEGQQ
jgi:hypothetical protein